MTSNRGAGHVGPLAPLRPRVPSARATRCCSRLPEGAQPARRGRRPAAARVGRPSAGRGHDAAMASFAELHPSSRARHAARRVRGHPRRPSLPARAARRSTGSGPDMILREPTEFAGLLAAERLGVPYARIGIWPRREEHLEPRRSWRPCSTPIAARFGMPPTARRALQQPVPDRVPRGARGTVASPGRAALPRAGRRPVALPAVGWRRAPAVYATYGSVVPGLPGSAEIFRATVERSTSSRAARCSPWDRGRPRPARPGARARPRSSAGFRSRADALASPP